MAVTASTTTGAYVLGPGEGETSGGWHFMTLKASTPDFGAMRVSIETGSEPPMHFHSREDEWYYVLDGELVFHLEGKALRAGPGSFAFLPRGVPHTLTVEGTGRAEVLLMVTPGGFERMFPEANTPHEPGAPPPAQRPLDPAVVGPILERYGIVVVGPHPRGSS